MGAQAGSVGDGCPGPQWCELCLDAELELRSLGWESDLPQVQEECKVTGNTSLQI